MCSSDSESYLQNNRPSTNEGNYIRLLLLKDFEYLSERIKQLEQAIEKRASYYFKTIFLGTVGLFFMVNLRTGFFTDVIVQLLIFVSFLFFLLIFGSIAFLMNIKQNAIADNYKLELRRICESLNDLDPHPGPDQLNMQCSNVVNKQNGQVYIIAALNSIISVVFCNLLLFYVLHFLERDIRRMLCIGFMTFLSIFLFHCSFINIRTSGQKK